MTAIQPLQRIGPYELDGELGRGGMGVIYRATHTALRRPCALKLIMPHAPPAALERFRREAQAVARLGKHENIVQVYDVGEADGRTYIAMELIEGVDLAKT